MRHWTFWEWVAYAAMFVGALIIAAETGFRTEPEVMAHLPDFFRSSVWGFAPAVLMSFATIVLFLREFVFPRSAASDAAASVTATEGNVSFDPHISITSPANGSPLEEGEQSGQYGCSYLVRVKTPANLPDDHNVWILNENPLSKEVWPQDFPLTRGLRPGDWVGRTFISKGQAKVTIVAVIVPPTSHYFFEYYHKVRAKSKELFGRELLIPLGRLPPECKYVDRVQPVIRKVV